MWLCIASQPVINTSHHRTQVHVLHVILPQAVLIKFYCLSLFGLNQPLRPYTYCANRYCEGQSTGARHSGCVKPQGYTHPDSMHMRSLTCVSCREVQLAALLLYNAKLGQESKWYPWIQALPTKFYTLPHWTAAELDELQLGTTTTELGFRSEVRPLLCSFFWGPVSNFLSPPP